MATITIKNWKTHKHIFSHTIKDNTIEKTIDEAITSGAWWQFSDLESLAYTDGNNETFPLDLTIKKGTKFL